MIKVFKCWILWGIALILIGCQGRSVYQVPEVNVPCEWHHAVPMTPSDNLTWWGRLSDPLLNQLMAHATAENLDLKIAAIRLLRAKTPAQRQIAQDNLCEARITLSAEIATQYIEWRGLQYRLEIATQLIDIQEEVLKLTHQLLERGLVQESAYRQFEADLSTLKSERAPLEADSAQAMNRISRLVALPPGDLLICSASPRLPDAPFELCIGDPTELLCKRPDIRKAQHAYQLRGTQEALYTYQKTVLDALEEVENALVAYSSEQARLSELREAYRHQQEALASAEELRQRGVSDELALTQVKKSLLSAEERLVRSQVELLLHYVSLYKALGGS